MGLYFVCVGAGVSAAFLITAVWKIADVAVTRLERAVRRKRPFVSTVIKWRE
jgi:hypothetical protein